MPLLSVRGTRQQAGEREPLGLTLLTSAFPADGEAASLASGAASRASGSLPDRWSVALAGHGLPGYRGRPDVVRSTGGSFLEGVGGAAVVLDGDPALLGERLDAGRTAELAVTGVLHAAEGGHGLVGDALIVDVDDP